VTLATCALQPRVTTPLVHACHSPFYVTTDLTAPQTPATAPQDRAFSPTTVTMAAFAQWTLARLPATAALRTCRSFLTRQTCASCGTVTEHLAT